MGFAGDGNLIRDFIRAYNQQHHATVLLTSHYMADVTALASRILVIEQGKLRYDGDLSALVEQTAPYKLLRLVLDRSLDDGELKTFGDIETIDGLKVTLRVPRQRVKETAARVLAQLPVDDVIFEDPPILEAGRFPINFYTGFVRLMLTTVIPSSFSRPSRRRPSWVAWNQAGQLSRSSSRSSCFWPHPLSGASPCAFIRARVAKVSFSILAGLAHADAIAHPRSSAIGDVPTKWICRDPVFGHQNLSGWPTLRLASGADPSILTRL